MSPHEDDDDDDDEPLTLGSDSLAALQSVLGSTNLEELLNSRRLVDDESSVEQEEEEERNSNDGEEAIRPGESHADYYKRLYPERYAATTSTSTTNSKEQESSSLSNKIANPIAIVSMDDDYVQALILKCFENRPNWKVLTTVPTLHENRNEQQEKSVEQHQNHGGGQEDLVYHFHWGEYEHIDWFGDRFMAEEIIVSCYYNRKGFIRKGLLANILEKWFKKKTETTKRFAPVSYVLKLPRIITSNHNNDNNGEDEDEEVSCQFQSAFEESLRNSHFPGFRGPSDTWILKPSITNQANGICLVQSKLDLLKAMNRADPVQQAGDFVLQQYINPLLLDGRKFHLRVFMVLHGNVTAYVFPDFLAIFSLEPYEANNIENTRAHLTNIAHQEVLSLNDQHKCMRLFKETTEDMVRDGLASNEEEAMERIRSVQSSVYQTIGETVEAVSSELTFTSKNNCFEIFGLDFMIDPQWNVWLLEANAEPDLSKAGDRLQPIIDKLLVETLSLVVDGKDSRFVVANHNNTINGSNDEDKDEQTAAAAAAAATTTTTAAATTTTITTTPSSSSLSNKLSFVKVYERKGRSF